MALELGEVLDALRRDGITVLDVADPIERNLAVAATIEVGLYRSDHPRAQSIPGAGGIRVRRDDPRRSCRSALAHQRDEPVYCPEALSASLPGLLADYRREPDRLAMHDVFRSYLRQLTAYRRAELDAAIIDAHRELLPPDQDPGPGWAAVPGEHKYLWSWLATHLHAAGLSGELDAVLTDWVADREADPSWASRSRS